MATININKNLVRERVNGQTGETFLSVSVPPRYKGMPWGSFTCPVDAMSEGADDQHVVLDIEADKTYVAFGMGDAKKVFGYKPETLAARMTPRAKKQA